jgi:hypothetical protein
MSSHLMASLSALLAEATPDPMYLQAANESAGFIRSHLYSFRGIVQEDITVDVNSAFACQVVNLHPGSSGLMIEGLSILASITNSASTEKLCAPPVFIPAHVPTLEIVSGTYLWQSFLILIGKVPTELYRSQVFVSCKFLNSSLLTYTLAGDMSGDMNLPQGFGTFYVRNSTNSTLRQYVGDYIAVQVWSVRHSAVLN